MNKTLTAPHPFRSAALAGALLTGLLLGCAAEDKVADSEVAAESPAPSSPAPSSVQAPQTNAAGADRPRLGPRPFWHDSELAAALGLDEAQISVMETRRQAALGEQRSQRQAATELRTRLSDFLIQGSWDEASRLSNELAKKVSSDVEADFALKAGILEMLTPEQRQRLAQENPGALRRSWLTPGSRGRGSSAHNPILDGD